MFDTILVDMLVHGNMLKKHAIALSSVVTSIFSKEKEHAHLPQLHDQVFVF